MIDCSMVFFVPASATTLYSITPTWVAFHAQVRYGCEALIRTCQMETQLFEQFFSPGAAANGAAEHAATAAGSTGASSAQQLSSLVDPLATLLYDLLRPALIHLQVRRDAKVRWN